MTKLNTQESNAFTNYIFQSFFFNPFKDFHSNCLWIYYFTQNHFDKKPLSLHLMAVPFPHQIIFINIKAMTVNTLTAMDMKSNTAKTHLQCIDSSQTK